MRTGLRSQHYLDRGTDLASGPSRGRAAAQLETLEANLRKADHHTPNTRARVLLANVQVARRKPARAVALLRPVLREEPENIQAWFVLVAAERGRGDPRALAAAQRRIRHLSPLTR